MKRLIALVLTLGALLAIPQSAYAKPLARVAGTVACFSPIGIDYDNDGVDEQCLFFFQFSAFDGESANRPDSGSFVSGYKDVATGKWVRDASYQIATLSAVRVAQATSQQRVFSFDVTYADGRVEHYCGSDSGRGYQLDSFLQLNIYADHAPSVACDFPLSGGDIKVY